MPEIVVFLFCACALVTQFRASQGHGYLMDPPSRSSMWREDFDVPKNYDDNKLNCGGYYVQWGLNRGRCGICGDPYQDPQPRDNESGGIYGKGVVSRTYTAGQVVPIKVMITSNHLGWFEFRLCPSGSPTTPVTQDCLDRYVLPLAEGSGQRWSLGSQRGEVTVKVKLPATLTCTQCVLQWRWHAGNNFGEDDNGRKCKGCGPQEEFYGCADIHIRGSGGVMGQGPPSLAPITNAPKTLAPITFRPNIYPTSRTITFAPITNKPFVRPFQPITNQPFTRAPSVTARPSSQVFPTFMKINFPLYTKAPSRAPPLTFNPFLPITRSPNEQPTFRPATNQPIGANNLNQLPSGFVPISPAPGNIN